MNSDNEKHECTSFSSTFSSPKITLKFDYKQFSNVHTIGILGE